MTTLAPPYLTLDPRYDRIIAELTRRLAETARATANLTPPPCGHDFLVPLLRPDFVQAAVWKSAPR